MSRPASMTVVFTDVVGSTAWRFRVGGWAADELTILFDRVSRDVVVDHGGDVVKGVGDGLMATFGGAASAFDAAVDLQTVARRVGVGSGLRVGISSGDLVRDAGDWVGDAAIEASRLCNEAGGGEIFCSDVAVRLAGSRVRHELRDAGQRLLRGFDHEIAVFELMVEPDRVLPGEIAQASASPCFGRDADLDDLVASISRAADGGSCAEVIEGEPGIGKSQLAAHVGLRAQRAGFRVLYGRCEEGQSAPYGALVAAFEPWLLGCPAPLLARVAGPPNVAGLLHHVPAVSSGLNDSIVDEGADPRVRRARALDGLCDLARAVSVEQPVLLIVDDLHWAEASTALALEHFVEQRLPGFAILATTRELRGEALSIDAVGDAGTVRHLGGLSDRAVAELFASRVGEDAPADIAAALNALTAGNPFFLDAWLSDPTSIAQLRRPDGSWWSAIELGGLEVPQGVRGVVRRHVAMLDSSARRALQAGAVMGLVFDATCCRNAIGVDLTSWMEAVGRCSAVGLVDELAAGRYEFKHAIVRQTILDDMSLTLRATMHWRVGEALEEFSPNGRRSEIAMHYGAGIDVGDPTIVARAGWAAGDEAARATAYEEAAVHYQMVLTALHRLPDDVAERYRALAACGRALNAAGDIVAAGPMWLRAADAARSLEDPDRLFEAAHGYGAPTTGHDDEFVDLLDAVLDMLGPAESPLKAIALGWRAVPTAFVQAKRRPGIDWHMLATAVDMAERSGDAKAIASTLRSRSVAASHGPDAEAMREDLATVTGLGRAHDLAINDEPSILFVELAVAELRLGRLDAAEAALDDARTVSTRNRSNRGLRNVAVLRAAMSAAAGRFGEAKVLARQARGDGDRDAIGQLIYSAQTLAVRYEEGRLTEVIAALRDFEQLGLSMRAWSGMLTGALADAGEQAEARTRLAAAIKALTDGEQGFADQLLLRHLAGACRHLNDAPAASALSPYLDPWAGQLLAVPYGTSIEGAADRARGQLLSTMDLFDDADDAFTSAEALERRNGFAALAVRTAYWRGVNLLTRRTPSDKTAGGELLQQVAEESQRLGMTRLAQQAEIARSDWRPRRM